MDSISVLFGVARDSAAGVVVEALALLMPLAVSLLLAWRRGATTRWANAPDSVAPVHKAEHPMRGPTDEGIPARSHTAA